MEHGKSEDSLTESGQLEGWEGSACLPQTEHGPWGQYQKPESERRPRRKCSLWLLTESCRWTGGRGEDKAGAHHAYPAAMVSHEGTSQATAVERGAIKRYHACWGLSGTKWD